MNIIITYIFFVFVTIEAGAELENFIHIYECLFILYIVFSIRAIAKYI